MEKPIDSPKAPNDKILKAFLPDADTPDRWSEYFVFTHDFDGCAAYPNNLGEIANEVCKDWFERKVLPDDLTLLRSYQFTEARPYPFIRGYPSGADIGYIDALGEKIKTNDKQ